MANTPVNYQLTRTANAIPEIFVGGTFAEIKQNLIEWLNGQNEFLDYDFEGSRLNVLCDLLAYNTLYIQQFGNAAVYESFMRTANLRSSVVQAAQDNGYLPTSKSAAQTEIMLTCTDALNRNYITIPRGTRFLAYAKDTSVNPYNFVSTEDVIAIRDKNNQYFPRLKLAQGRIVRTEIIYDKLTPIIIYDKNIDRNQVKLYVDGAEWINWTRKSMVHAGSTSTIYYMRETIDGNTEFYFGEGEISVNAAEGALTANYIGGLKPTQNSTIVIEYISTNGADANGAVGFSYADTLTNITVININENPNDDPDFVGADGGGDPEDIERIRELGTIKRETQQRCVTATDYDTFVSERFGSIIQAVQTFTDSTKPGYAFIAAKPKSGLYLTTVQREDIKNYLKDYNLAPITPSIISPNYLFIKTNLKVTYALNKLQESEQWLEGQIIDKIDRYYTEDVEIFNSSFAKSKMLTYVDDADHSIIGSSATIQIVREVQNFYKTPEAGIKYNNQIKDRSMESNTFSFNSGRKVVNPDTGLEEDVLYDVRIVSTDRDSKGIGKVIIGPFASGDVTENENIQPYTGNDFNKLANSDGRDKYYVIGEINYPADVIYWNIAKINLTSEKFEVQTIELYSDPTDDVIFTRDGSLIVFENDLRPQYLTIDLEPISQ
ncbi:baseplate wedge subunit [Enterobacteria phage phiC600P9]|uniref:Baseplate wedge protein gp6 n=1 Tax=Citrobacter phage vB_CroM_CrRp10 TaxID=2079276 RepID=A0A2K9VBC8_9CAUD|nr:baseplate wedge subunit [Citrobacter phage vB_CroM_CrRp10]EFW3029454.1 baseplate wedge subunit [Shigella flexneri]QNI20238.1 baseplate wedge subunit [Enterobacteria phage phiC600P9]UCR75066.1 baseplate wedge protein [Escherichia phage vB_EcoM_C2-3]UMM76378.1 baseplate wedge subunit [Escherichia phage UTI-E4]URY15599.1 baseplate wedge subunit [Shigella phage ESh33]WAX12920.1 baseplate wedge protein [Escherichia phage ECO07P1]WCS66747.1 baseplate wedge subunit [Escherichia phage KIT06]